MPRSSIEYMCAKLGADSSSSFSFRAGTHTEMPLITLPMLTADGKDFTSQQPAGIQRLN